MAQAKKKDNNILHIERQSSLKDTISSVISQELELLEQKSKKYHTSGSIQDAVKSLGDEFEMIGQQKAKGVINFEIPKNKIGQKKAIIVENGQPKQNISVDDLPEAIKKNKNINRVIIEEINLNDVKRTQIHFDQTRPPVNKRTVALEQEIVDNVISLGYDNPNDHVDVEVEIEDTPTAKAPEKVVFDFIPQRKTTGEQQSDNNLTNAQLEQKINQDFFAALPSLDKPAHLRAYDSFHKAKQKINHIDLDNQPISRPTQLESKLKDSEKLAEIKERQANHFADDTDKLEQQKNEESDEGKINFNFTLNNKTVTSKESPQKIELSMKKESETFDVTSKQENGNYFEAHKTEFRRKKELAQKSISSLYYKTKKHNELFKLGTLYYRDLEAGLKSFAFTAQDDGNPVAQQNTILGLAAYFSYHMKMTSTVFTQSFENSVFKRADKNYDEEEIELDEGLSVRVYAYTDLKIIELCELEKIVQFSDVTVLEETLENIIDNHELVFWDLPSPKEMEKSNELYFPITRVIDNVSLIIKPNNSRIKDLLALKEYFEKYHIQIKGMIMSDQEKVTAKDATP